MSARKGLFKTRACGHFEHPVTVTVEPWSSRLGSKHDPDRLEWVALFLSGATSTNVYLTPEEAFTLAANLKLAAEVSLKRERRDR